MLYHGLAENRGHESRALGVRNKDGSLTPQTMTARTADNRAGVMTRSLVTGSASESWRKTEHRHRPEGGKPGSTGMTLRP